MIKALVLAAVVSSFHTAPPSAAVPAARPFHHSSVREALFTASGAKAARADNSDSTSAVSHNPGRQDSLTPGLDDRQVRALLEEHSSGTTDEFSLPLTRRMLEERNLPKGTRAFRFNGINVYIVPIGLTVRY